MSGEEESNELPLQLSELEKFAANQFTAYTRNKHSPVNFARKTANDVEPVIYLTQYGDHGIPKDRIPYISYEMVFLTESGLEVINELDENGNSLKVQSMKNTKIDNLILNCGGNKPTLVDVVFPFSEKQYPRTFIYNCNDSKGNPRLVEFIYDLDGIANVYYEGEFAGELNLSKLNEVSSNISELDAKQQETISKLKNFASEGIKESKKSKDNEAESHSVNKKGRLPSLPNKVDLAPYVDRKELANKSNTKWSGLKDPGLLQKSFEICNWACGEANLNEAKMAAFFQHESGFNPDCVSPTGCQGYGQFTKSTFDFIKNKKFTFGDGTKETIVERYKSIQTDDGTTIKPNWNDRTDPYANAIATAFLTRHNMDALKTDNYLLGYFAHNIGLGGTAHFNNNLLNNPRADVDMNKNYYSCNPANFGPKNDPCSYKEAHKLTNENLSKRYEEARKNGYRTSTELKNNSTDLGDHISQAIDQLKQSGVVGAEATGRMPIVAINHTHIAQQQGAALS